MKIIKGIPDQPSKDLIYGVEGVGKTGLSSTYPNPVFLDFEGSTVKMDVPRLIINNYSQYIEAHTLLLSEDGDDFQTVVYDTTDWLEKIVVNEILRQDGAKTITDDRLYSFGRGGARIEEFFRTNIIPNFESLMSTGKNVVLVSHAQIKGVDDPILGRFDHYTLKMSKDASAVLKEWVNNVFFLNYNQTAHKKFKEKTTVSGGKEVIVYTQRAPQYNAKRRDKLADEIKFIEGVNPYPQIIGVKEVVKIPLLEGTAEFDSAVQYLSEKGKTLRKIKRKYTLSPEVEEKLLSKTIEKNE